MNYAVLRYSMIDGVRHLSLDTIFEHESSAVDYCKVMNEHCNVRTHYVVQAVRACRNVVESDIITRCYNIANCLELVERDFLKRGSGSDEKALYWFEQIKLRCSIAAKLIDTLDV